MRFCMSCGQEVGDLPTCGNPECQGLPNFYRDVPGPAALDSYFPQGGGAVAAPRQEPRPAVAPDGGRQTLALSAQPVALLRCLTPPIVELLLYPGANEVGARPPAGLLLDRPDISSRHAKIRCEKAAGKDWRIVLEDLGSRNGTYVNGERIKSKVLASGDRIKFASAELELRLLDTGSERVTVGL